MSHILKEMLIRNVILANKTDRTTATEIDFNLEIQYLIEEAQERHLESADILIYF